MKIGRILQKIEKLPFGQSLRSHAVLEGGLIKYPPEFALLLRELTQPLLVRTNSYVLMSIEADGVTKRSTYLKEHDPL